MFTLRHATLQDQPDIRWLVHTGRINPMGLDWRRFILAVDEGGQVIGCAQVKPHADGSRELASLVVHPAWRDRGIARALIEHLITANPGELHLICRAELGPLYEKFGFRALEAQEMPRYFRRIARLGGLLNRFGNLSGDFLVMRQG